MAHIHSIYDTDPHFVVNPKTRTLINKSENKIVLVQYDHNSERITFELPRLIDGHDMQTCNVVRIHYCNVDAATKQVNKDVYEVDDLQLSPESDDVVIFSWLVSRNATQLVGALSFVIEFSCVSLGLVEYAWHTAMTSLLSVTSGMSNSAQVVSDYADVLQQWYDQLFSAGGGDGGGGGTGADGFSPVATVQQTDEGAEVTVTDKNGTTRAVLKHGQDGVGIAGVEQQTASLDPGGQNVMYVRLTDGTVGGSFAVCNGKNGQDGQDGKDGAAGATGPQGPKGDTGATGPAGQDGKDYSFDPTVYGLPVLYLTGDTAGMTKETPVTLAYVYGERSGSCTLKWQGSSSLSYEKKNYTVKFDTAFEAAEGWTAQTKYCLKANFIDTTHARNVVTAKLWGQMAKSRATLPSEWANLPNAGAVDGFPIVIVLNGNFHGLYTFNVPKDGWMFGLAENSEKTQAIVCANKESEPVMFKAEAKLDGTDFEIEFISDETNTAWAKTSLNRLIKACMDTTGYDLDTTIAQYLDWESAIDHYILTVLLGGSDILDKNFLLVTLDGAKWYFSAYDLDTTYGLKWNGSGLRAYNYAISFDECAVQHRVYELIKRFKTDALKARYNALRKTVWAEQNVYTAFENFAWAIPSPVMVEDVKKHPTILGSAVNGIDQILRWVHKRLEVIDEWANALPAQEVPVEPETPVEIVNQVPISTDTDGSIFNGVGYKENVRLSSSGGVSSTALTGSVTTGFIPCKAKDVLRFKGADWLGATSNVSGLYIIYYNSAKTMLNAMSLSSYNKGDYANTYSVSYDDATGVTTCMLTTDNTTTGLGEIISTAAYVRFNAMGKGADLIATVNQEIN